MWQSARVRLTRRGRVVAWSAGLLATGVLVGWAHAADRQAPAVIAGRLTSPARASAAAVLPAEASPGTDSPAAAGTTDARPAPAGQGSSAADRTGTSATAQSPPVTAGSSGTGLLVLVPGASGVGGSGPLHRYRVRVEAGTGEDPAEFAAAVQQTLADPRGWGADGQMSFQRVSSGPVGFTVVLASPRTTDRLCAPLRTNGTLSCHSSAGAIVNDLRWRTGAPAYGDDLASYRQYVISHEVGHALGHGHKYSCGPGGLAPTMMQQTKGVGSCTPNPWPYPGED